MKTLLQLQKQSTINVDRDNSEPMVHSPIKRGQRRVEARLKQGEVIHDGDRPISRAVQKLANRYSVIQNKKTVENL